MPVGGSRINLRWAGPIGVSCARSEFDHALLEVHVPVRTRSLLIAPLMDFLCSVALNELFRWFDLHHTPL